jgi:hypothetical protein
MDRFYPGSGWLKLSRSTLDELLRFKARRAVSSWDQVVDILLAESKASEPGEVQPGEVA